MDASTSTASAGPRVYGLKQLFPEPDDEAATSLKKVEYDRAVDSSTAPHDG
ncbi:hypothetical protein AUP68_15452 [Ilyonectria robusta]